MSFPFFPPTELADALRDFGYNELVVEDILKPNPSKMAILYEWLLSYLTNITREDIRNAVKEVLQDVHHPNVYEYRVTVGAFKDAIDHIMRCASIYDFSDRDLMAPTPERVRRLLSGMVNFILFEIEQSKQTLQPLEEGLEQLQNQRAELMAREAAYMERITLVKQQQEEEERLAADLLPQIDAFKATILECKDTEGPLDQRRLDLQEAKKTISEQNRTTYSELRRVEAEIQRLSNRVASSPEEVRIAIDSLQKSLASEMASISSLEQNSRLLEQKIKANDKYANDLTVCLKLADEWEIEMGRLDEVRKTLNSLSDKYETQLPKLQEVEKKTTQAQRRTELLKEQLDRAHTGFHKKRKAGKERQSKAIARHEAAIAAQLEHEREWQHLVNLKAHLTSQIENEVEEYIRGLKKGQIVYENLRTEILHYTMKHQAAINAVEAKLPTSETKLLPSIIDD